MGKPCYVPTLKEIARLEREIDPRGQSMDQAKMPPDRGEIDNIIFTLSISTLIKEFNSTNSRFIEATEGKAFGGLSVEQYDDEQVNETGRYAIPSDQDRVDQIYEQTSGALQDFAIDTNDDGILDTACIMFVGWGGSAVVDADGDFGAGGRHRVRERNLLHRVEIARHR